MPEITVTESIDIRAPRAEVWDIVGNLDKRMRLSPLWDVVSIESLTAGPYGLGSRFRIHTRRNDVDILHETEVVEFVPGSRATHQLAGEPGTRTTWSILDCAVGTRVMYEDTFD